MIRPGDLCLGTGSWTVWDWSEPGARRLGTIRLGDVGLVVAVDGGGTVMIAWANGLVGWCSRNVSRVVSPARESEDRQ